MRTGLLLSLLLHLLVAVLALVGVPHLFDPAPAADQPIRVQVVRVSDETRAPPPAPEAKPERQAKPKPPAEQAEAPEPKPAPKPAPKTAAPPPPPPPPPEPVAQPEPMPKAEPEPAPAPPPKAVAVPKPKPAPPKPKAEPKPKKPEPPKTPKPVPTPETKKKPEPKRDEFESLLKTVEEFKEKPRPPSEQAEEDFAEAVREALNLDEERARARTVAEALTLSEIDAIRAQIERNWRVPAGVRDAEDLVVAVYVELNPDGSVVDARIIDMDRYARDRLFRIAADSARRAVLMTNRIEGLSDKKYSRWRSMILKFNPEGMVY